ncbi:LCP family protein [Pseudofrankia sp. DC12]|uniref:LCP family protein n=1 Tax=Pseudofrankia sp. DC12 TaxID=683315 RepID=UPI0005F76653|nr:LCP family protein [Pseudofrankia sp. DC12]
MVQAVGGLVSFALFAFVVGGWASSVYLTGNIRTSRLDLGFGPQGTEKPDAAGKTPMNILVLGSDTRSSATDCQIGGSDGGACGTGTNATVGANADVEMLVHLSANRTNATVMSIPRDTVTDLPACKDPTSGYVYPEIRKGQINSSLGRGGPGCTVAAVHQLTGAVIDHFVMVDFGGVVSMSDAIGGVSVCVDNNVYDPYSQLKLAKGTHTLKGLAALEFLRTRHGFGDGSDLGREAAQHVFLSALIQKLKSANTLSNPVTLLSLANAATKALTVDDSLAGGPSPLVSLAGQLNDVPTNRITFVTMPNVPDPSDTARVIPAPGARELFQEIDNDQSLSGGQATTTPQGAATTAPVTVAPSTVRLTVENGSGYPGRASKITTSLQARGYTLVRDGGNGPATAATRLSYEPDEQAAARTVASALGLPAGDLSATSTSTSLVLNIGSDWPTGTTLSATPTASTTGPVTAPTNANPLNAAASNGCVHVSTQDTTQFGSPSRAYARSPKIPDSDSTAARQM